MEGNKEV